MSFALDIDRYLRRIGVSARLSPTAPALATLQRQHLLTVPFENLDIGRVPLDIDPAALFDKIVVRRRGGFCYELNGLFALLLEGLGYRVDRLSARVYGAGGVLGPQHDHLALRVRPDGDGDWLADVGFGAAFAAPLDLTSTAVQHQTDGAYRLRRDGDQYVYAARNDDGVYADEYVFDLTPYPLSAFADMCHYHQTSPDSPFTQKRVCTRLTDTGRVTLRDRELITTTRGDRATAPIADDDAWRAALRAHFGCEL